MSAVSTAVVLALAGLAQDPAASPAKRPELTALSLEELANIEVTSVSRRRERVADAPASVFVITAEDVRRSGATTLAEALRLAPSLQVARLDSTQYAISARGFNNTIANKLLVLVDGRTIYTPLFSGVFWDQQDVLLEDVERIEIISGPGATLWGANAVNGVINIITRSARDTHGIAASLGAGNREQVGALRFGGGRGDRFHFRVYAKAAHTENTERANGTAVPDGRDWAQGGFRVDWESPVTAFTLQGDAYRGRSQDRGVIAGFTLGRVELSGVNALARWSRKLGEASEIKIQAYVDHSRREEPILFQPEADLVDVELQHAVPLGAHRLLWGGGYRHGRDDVKDGILVGFRPARRDLDWMNVFVQDEFPLPGKLELSAGVKLERNDYTGWETLPSVRLAWKPAGDHLAWGAVSRAVRAPARLDREVIQPLGGAVFGGPDFKSEVATVFEVGYRGRPIRTLSGSVTAFLHQWDRLRSGTAPPVIIENRIEGPVYGVESWLTWQPIGGWRLSGGLTTLRKKLRLEPGSTDPVGTNNPGLANDPGHQWMLRSSATLWTRHDLDAAVRRVARLTTPRVPAYTAVDARYAWRPLDGLELSVVARNLFDPRHGEFGSAPGRSEHERGVFFNARWSR